MIIKHIFAASMACFFASSVFAASMNDSALDKRGNFVVSSDGECVRTKWTVASDPCAPEPPPAPKMVQAPPVSRIALEQRTIYFDFNEAELRTEGKAKLDSLANIVLQSKGIRHATVIGYADEIGKDADNLMLSQKRADAVREYLGSRIAVPTSVLLVQGKGATNSVTHCPETMKRTERITCLAKDRRVEVEFNYVR